MQRQIRPYQSHVQHKLRSGTGIVLASFGSEDQSSMGGLPLLGEVGRSTGLISGAASILRDWRQPGKVDHSLEFILAQRVLLTCAGEEDGIDSNHHAHDPALRLALSIALNLDEIGRLASQSTVSRFENKIGRFNLYRLAMFLLCMYIARRKKSPKRLILYFDGSCVPARGEQQGSSYRGYYNTNMLFPLFIFDQDGYLITAILRPGKDGEAELVVPVLKRLVKAFRNEWPGLPIRVVMDSAFNDPNIYDWCEDNDVEYLIKLKAAGKPGGGLFASTNELARRVKISFAKRHGQPEYVGTRTTKNDVETAIKKLSKDEKKEKLKNLRKRLARSFDEFEHRTGKGGKDPKQWRQPRRVLAVCTYDDWGERRSFWVTNIVGRAPQYLIETVYSKRGEAELFIKDSKSFRCDKLSCEEFFANQCRLLMQVLVYQLMYELRKHLPKSLRTMTLASLRERFIKIPVIVRSKSRSTDLIWSKSFPWKNRMHSLVRRLSANFENSTNWCMRFRHWLKGQILTKPPSLSLAA